MIAIELTRSTLSSDKSVSAGVRPRATPGVSAGTDAGVSETVSVSEPAEDTSADLYSTEAITAAVSMLMIPSTQVI